MLQYFLHLRVKKGRVSAGHVGIEKHWKSVKWLFLLGAKHGMVKNLIIFVLIDLNQQ
jgi:hypothetical protein